jgi:hypothetical protein
MLMARSGHTSVRSLAKYARVSAEALARHQAEHDPARRQQASQQPLGHVVSAGRVAARLAIDRHRRFRLAGQRGAGCRSAGVRSA